MKFHWLLSSCLSVCLLSTELLSDKLVAQAASLQTWRFDASANRLHFTTEGGVQPKAQLIFNPTRLVIDLPGVRLDRSAITEPVSERVGIQSIRVGQFDRDTTRLVIQLSPGYTLDPQGVKFRGLSPTQWTVELPTPTPLDGTNLPSSSPVSSAPEVSTLPSNETKTVSDQPSALPANEPNTVIQGVEITKGGFQVLTTGTRPAISLQQSRGGDIAILDIQGATLSPQVKHGERVVNEFGVERMEIRQLPTEPPTTRVTLRVKETHLNWRSIVNWQGVILFPGNQRMTTTTRPIVSSNPSPITAVKPVQTQKASIESVDLANNGNQLLIRASQPVSYTSGWDQSSQAYWLRISQAQLRNSLPTLPPGSPVVVSGTQENADTVVLWVQPRGGTRIGGVNQLSNQLIALQLQPMTRISPISSIQPIIPPRTEFPNQDLQPIPRGKTVVVLDPGHGGRDPGAVGIGGIQEKEIVLDITYQVASLLEQQGVQAILTRRDDREIDLEPRVTLAERVNATVFVSIHANAISMSRPDVNGIETYYFDNGQRLAQVIHRGMLESTGARDRRVRQARFYVLRKTSMPSVLVEVGFVTGAEDAPRLADPAYRSQLARGIANGILQYLRQGY